VHPLHRRQALTQKQISAAAAAAYKLTPPEQIAPVCELGGTLLSLLSTTHLLFTVPPTCSTHGTLYTVHCTLYTVHCTTPLLYTVPPSPVLSRCSVRIILHYAIILYYIIILYYNIT